MMKKLLIITFITLLGMTGIKAQSVFDTVTYLPEENFDTFLPTDWDTDTSSLYFTWQKAEYLTVTTTSGQNDTLMTPWIRVDTLVDNFNRDLEISWAADQSGILGNGVNVNLLYQTPTSGGWVAALDVDATQFTGTDSLWYYLNVAIDGPTFDDSVMFAVEYTSTSGDVDGYFSVGNVAITGQSETTGADTAIVNEKFSGGVPAGWTAQGAWATQSANYAHTVNATNELLNTPVVEIIDTEIPAGSTEERNYIVEFDYRSSLAGTGLDLNYSLDSGTTFFTFSLLSATGSDFVSSSFTIPYSFLNPTSEDDTTYLSFQFEGDFGAVDVTNVRILRAIESSLTGTPDTYDRLVTNLAPSVVDRVDFPTYPNDYPEIFLDFPPEFWTLDSSATEAPTWGIEFGEGYWNNDNSGEAAVVFGGEANEPQDESLIVDIAHTTAPLGANYYATFDYKLDGIGTFLSEGGDPLVDPSADFRVYLTIDGGTEQLIWQEDDSATIESTIAVETDAFGNESFVLGSYPFNTGVDNYADDGDDRWYTAAIDLTPFINDPTVTGYEIRFEYTGQGAGDVYLDNFAVWEGEYDPFDPDFIIENPSPYAKVPELQLKDSSTYLLNVGLVSNGAMISADTLLRARVNGNLFGYDSIRTTDFTTPYPDTTFYQMGLVSGGNYAARSFLDVLTGATSYTVSYEFTVNGTTYTDSETVPFQVTANDEYSRWDGSFGNTVRTDMEGQVGTIFEFENSDVIDQVELYIQTYSGFGTEINFTLIELANIDDATGSLVASSRTFPVTGTGVETFDVNMEVDPGIYVLMVNQLDNNNVTLYMDNEGSYLTGRSTGLTEWIDGDPAISIFLEGNTDPMITTEFGANDVVTFVVGEATSYTLEAEDPEEDAITFSITDTVPAFLGTWIQLNDNGDGTAEFTGTPTVEDLGVFDVTVEAEDARGGTDTYTFEVRVISRATAYELDYLEDFNGLINPTTNLPYDWDALLDQNNTGTNQHWIESGNELYINNDDLAQNEWAISAPISLPALSAGSDSIYTFSFDWSMSDYRNFILGNDVLGSGSDGNGNFADVKVRVSTDNGVTWSDPIWWDEDDDALAATTDGIAGGLNYPEGILSSINPASAFNSELDITQYAGNNILIAFQYESKNPNNYNTDFYVDNVEVFLNDEFSLSTIVYTDLDFVNRTQLTDGGTIEFEAIVINDGYDIPEDAELILSLPEDDYYEAIPLSGEFGASDTISFVYTVMNPDITSGSDYTFSALIQTSETNAGAQTSDNYTVTVDNDIHRLDNRVNTTRTTVGLNDGLGVIYQLDQGDILDRIFVDFNSSGQDYSISIIRLSTVDATSGTLVATIDDQFGTQLNTFGSFVFVDIDRDNDIDENPYLEPGIYAIMVNPVEPGDAEIEMGAYYDEYDRSAFGLGYVRGNVGDIYMDPFDEGNLSLYLDFEINNAPFFIDPSDNNTISSINVEAAEGAGTSFNIIARDNDEFDSVSISQVTMPAFLTHSWLTFSGSTVEIADTAPEGEYEAQLLATDGLDTAFLDINITIEENPAPFFTTNPVTTAYEGLAYTYIATGRDPLGDDITLSYVSGPAGIDSVTASGDSLILSFTPNATLIGTHAIKLEITDGARISEQSFVITVIPNEAPTIVSGTGIATVFVGETFSYDVRTVDDADESGITLSATVPGWLTFTDNGNGAGLIEGSPAEADAGSTDTVMVTATDAAGATDEIMFMITIPAVNQGPSFTSTAITDATQGVLYSYTVTATDPEVDFLSFSSDIPDWLIFNSTGNGTAKLYGTPNVRDTGSVDVVLMVTDGEATAEQAFTITVAAAASSADGGEGVGSDPAETNSEEDVDDPAKEPVVNLYPNPTEGIVYIEAEMNATGYLIDNLGRVVGEYTIADRADNRIDLRDFDRGIYMMKIIAGEETRMIRFILE